MPVNRSSVPRAALERPPHPQQITGSIRLADTGGCLCLVCQGSWTARWYYVAHSRCPTRHRRSISNRQVAALLAPMKPPRQMDTVRVSQSEPPLCTLSATKRLPTSNRPGHRASRFLSRLKRSATEQPANPCPGVARSTTAGTSGCTPASPHQSKPLSALHQQTCSPSILSSR